MGFLQVKMFVLVDIICRIFKVIEKPENRDPRPLKNRKTGNRDPSRTQAEPYKSRKIGTRDSSGTLGRPYKTRKSETRDLSGTLKIVWV